MLECDLIETDGQFSDMLTCLISQCGFSKEALSARLARDIDTIGAWAAQRDIPGKQEWPGIVASVMSMLDQELDKISPEGRRASLRKIEGGRKD